MRARCFRLTACGQTSKCRLLTPTLGAAQEILALCRPKGRPRSPRWPESAGGTRPLCQVYRNNHLSPCSPWALSPEVPVPRRPAGKPPAWPRAGLLPPCSCAHSAPLYPRGERRDRAWEDSRVWWAFSAHRAPSHQGTLKKGTLSSLISQRAFYSVPTASQSSVALPAPSKCLSACLQIIINMCVYSLGPLTAPSWPHDLGGIDGTVSPGSQVHLLLKVVST